MAAERAANGSVAGESAPRPATHPLGEFGCLPAQQLGQRLTNLRFAGGV